MKVLCCSEGGDWKRTGTAITYSKEAGMYCLEFIHEFDVAGRATYFAYGYPYGYNRHLIPYLGPLLQEPKFSKILRRSTLCLSAAGNPVPLLTITNFAVKEVRPIVYIIARQHPGETPASFIA